MKEKIISEPRFLRFELPEERICAMARADRDFVLQAMGDGRVSAVCKACVRALEIAESDELVWFRCLRSDRVSFYPVANVQRDIGFAARDGRPFLSDLFYMKQHPATLRSSFTIGGDREG
jgi:hypothetical protein